MPAAMNLSGLQQRHLYTPQQSAFFASAMGSRPGGTLFSPSPAGPVSMGFRSPTYCSPGPLANSQGYHQQTSRRHRSLSLLVDAAMALDGKNKAMRNLTAIAAATAK